MERVTLRFSDDAHDDQRWHVENGYCEVVGCTDPAVTFVRLDEVVAMVEATAAPFHKGANNPHNSFDVSTVSANAAYALDALAAQLKGTP